MSADRPIKTTAEADRICKLLSDYFLYEVWAMMGLDEEALRNRRETAKDILKKTLKEMKTEEETTLSKLVDRVESFGQERNRLAKELGIKPSDPDSDLGLVQLEKILRHEVQDLEQKKEEKMKEVRQLRKEDEELCTKLEMEPFYVSLKVIPAPEQVEGLRKHVDEMKKLKSKRLGEFSEAKLSILAFLELLEEEPNDSFERLVVCEDDDAFTLSQSNLEAVHCYLRKLEQKVEDNKKNSDEMRRKIFNLMDKLSVEVSEKIYIQENLSGHSPSVLKQLQGKLEELEKLKLEKMEEFILATRSELESLWDLCHYSHAQREKFGPYFSTDYTEELLDLHEQEVERLKNYFNENEGLFKKIAKRQELWHKMLELEEKKKDPNHLLKAKGKDLLIEERDRKRVNKMLPKIDEELKEAMAEYHRINGKPFLVGGQPFEDFMEEQITDFQCRQEAEREMKKKKKKEANFHETIYGSKPSKRTPALKRKAEATPNPNDTKRLRPAPSHLTGSTFRHSPYSGNRTSTLSRSKICNKPTQAKRKILGNHNGSILVSGNGMKHHLPTDTLSSVTSDCFMKDIPKAALTSTFQESPPQHYKTPNKTPRRRSARLKQQQQTPMFKTPSHRTLTPANKSSKKLTTLSDTRKVPFLI